MKLKYSMMKVNLEKEMNKEKFEGDCILREIEREIITKQNRQEKEYTEEEKVDLFEKGFSQALEKIKKTMKLGDRHKSELDRIKQSFEYLIKKSSSRMKELGLPKLSFELNSEEWISKTCEKIKEEQIKYIFETKLRTEDKVLRYIDQKYTNILKGSLTDAKLKYFNAKDYFKMEKKFKDIRISKRAIVESINTDVLFQLEEK